MCRAQVAAFCSAPRCFWTTRCPRVSRRKPGLGDHLRQGLSGRCHVSHLARERAVGGSLLRSKQVSPGQL